MRFPGERIDGKIGRIDWESGGNAEGRLERLADLLEWKKLTLGWIKRIFEKLGRAKSMSQAREGEKLPIAIIGGGMAGLVAGRTLQERGVRMEGFDKGGRPGGRVATRLANGVHQFDHGAQYFTVRDARVQAWVDGWLREGFVAIWRGRIVSVDEPGVFVDTEARKRYVGMPRMNRIGELLLGDVVWRWRTKVVGVRGEGMETGEVRYWLRDEGGVEYGPYGGLIWNCPPAQVAAMVPEGCAWRGELGKVEMLPCWAVLLRLETHWYVPFDGAFVNRGGLGWIARDSSKPGRPLGQDQWVLHATAEWTREHLEAEEDWVVGSMIEEAERMMKRAMPARVESMAHRWLYSRPSEPLVEAALWDGRLRLGACGDWCGAARVEGAWLSGMGMAERVLDS